MSQETIFISYSRDNTEFVMNLAKNLRKAGANIWLDQLDIKVGENWDNAIQNALTNASTFLIILSKDSVASNNVMDEVGYALGAEKKVIPVLIEQCEIPFRLQRRQFVDFTGNQQKGIDNLIEALNLDKTVADKLSDASNRSSLSAQKDLEEIKDMRESDKAKSVKEKAEKEVEKQTVKKDSQPITPKDSTTTTKKKSMMPILIGAGIVLLGLGIWQVPKLLDKESGAFEIAKTANSEASYNAFLKQFPDGNHAKEANDSILSIQGMDRLKADNAAWNAANTVEAVITYKAQYPEGVHINEVDDKLAAIKNLEADIAAWNSAKETNSVRSYIDYMLKDLDSKSKMDDAIKQLSSAGKAGWLYSGRNNGSDLQFKIIKAVDGREIDSNTIPKTGDIVEAKNTLNTYNSISGGRAVGGQGRSVARKAMAYVNNATVLGNAVFLEIVY